MKKVGNITFLTVDEILQRYYTQNLETTWSAFTISLIRFSLACSLNLAKVVRADFIPSLPQPKFPK